MAIDVKVPAVGESVAEGRIARWLKPDGAAVAMDEPIYELETDKASQEITAPAAGVLTIKVKEGETVKIGAIVAEIDPAKQASPASPASYGGGAVTKTPGITAGARPESGARTDSVKSAPSARALATETGVDVSKVTPTGPRGTVTKEDVANHATPANPASYGGGADASPTGMTAGARSETREPMTMVRKRIAERLLESQNTTATLTTFNEVDVSAVQALRAKYNEAFEKKHGVKLGFMSVFVKATVEALKAFPLVNARIEGTDVVKQHFYDIGVAVSTDKGLMVPIIRGADTLGFAEIEKAIAAAAKKARDGKISVAELQGGTFTITNGGVFGSLLSTPILNPPQSAILGMHTIQKRAVVIDDQIVIRPMMYLALSYDHRLIDGREAVQCLVRIKDCVEHPERMLFDI